LLISVQQAVTPALQPSLAWKVDAAATTHNDIRADELHLKWEWKKKL
jgi:hypothetical protein